MPRELLTETATVFAIYDKFPVIPIHVLLMLYGVTATNFDSSHKAQTACWRIVNRIRQLIKATHQSDSFTNGIKVQEAADQTVPHVPIPFTPKYNGDVEIVRVGVRGVGAERQQY